MNVKAARDFSDTSREKMADRGVAMPDGSYPIPDKDALRRAIASFGRAKNADAVKQHIIKRARALGAVDMLPEDWNVSAKGSMAAQHSAQAADILEDLYELIDCESDEPDHVAMLQSAAATMLKFLGQEHTEIGQPGDDMPMMNGKAGVKSLGELKAEPMDESQLDRWLSGKIPRRVLVVPFGGPLPGGKAGRGVDLDGEWFDEDTDLYGDWPALKASRERLVDWHHDEMYRKLGSVGDPTGMMKGATLGRVVLDENPEADGLWADFWANQGEQRLALIKRLESRNVPLFGSSQAVRNGWRKADDGHIELWPIVRHTITTSPQNTYAVVPPLKAVLTADLPFDEVGVAALKAAMVGLEDLGEDLRATSSGGKRAAKARRLSSVLTEAEAILPKLRERITLQSRS